MSDDLFSALEGKLAAARALAALPEAPPRSLLHRKPQGVDPLRMQSQFNLEITEALGAIVAAIREKAARVDAALGEVQQELVLWRGLSERMNKTLERVLEAEAQLEQGRREQRDQQEQLNGKHLEETRRLRDEQRDLLEKLLNEQRVCLKQLALRTSEEAVLGDRARRATELRLEEFGRRLEQLSPNGSASPAT